MTLASRPVLGQYVYLRTVESRTDTEQGIEARCAPGATLRAEHVTPTAVRVTLARDGYDERPLDLPLDVPEATGDTPLPISLSDACQLEIGGLATDPGLGIGWDGNEVRVWFTLEDDQFFGLGEKTGEVDKRGRAWTMWNSDIPGYGNDTDPVYQSIPFVLVRRGGAFYGLYLHNAHQSTFNLGAGNHRTWSISAARGPLDFVVFSGATPAAIVEQYTAMTGRMYLPPTWALGYQQCRWSYYPESEVRTLAETFRRKQIPADVLYFDIHYMNGYRVFSWDPERFPDPEALLADLGEMGFKTVVIVDPGVKEDTATDYPVAREGLDGEHFLRYPDGEVFVGSVWPGRSYFPDFSQPQTRDWWGGHVADYIAQGVDGIWNDMNEPAVWGKAFPEEVVGAGGDFKRLRNLYGYHMAQATYEGLRARFPDRRPFVLTRAGFAGEQRYTAVWTGDNTSSWEHLGLGIRMQLGLGMSGVAFNGMDVGGFEGHPSAELFTRWLQVGALSPLFRNHTANDTPDQEPWAFGERTEEAARRIIEDRYRYLPHLYTLMWEATQTGAPPWRPLWWHRPDDAEAYARRWQHEFFVGEHVLAAPVIEEGARFQEVYLPAGTWLDLGTGRVYEGERRVVVEAPLERLPLFLHAEGFFVTQESMQYVGEKDPAYLRLDVLPAAPSGRTVLYEDDGESFAFENGAFRVTEFGYANGDDGLVVTRRVKSDGYQPATRILEVRLYDRDRPASVRLGGEALGAAESGTGWSYEPDLRRLTVRMPETGTEQTLTIR